ncbi:hypothetical protein KASHIRA_02810 [Serratia phage vB_SmaM-Kashira]|nr:hypothetical protein KASHIRA_02810 [Serratia phage vB_SmaM-Kashira]
MTVMKGKEELGVLLEDGKKYARILGEVGKAADLHVGSGKAEDAESILTFTGLVKETSKVINTLVSELDKTRQAADARLECVQIYHRRQQYITNIAAKYPDLPVSEVMEMTRQYMIRTNKEVADGAESA